MLQVDRWWRRRLFIILRHCTTSGKRLICVGPETPICVVLGSDGTGLDADYLSMICVKCRSDTHLNLFASHLVYGATQMAIPAQNAEGNVRRTLPRVRHTLVICVAPWATYDTNSYSNIKKNFTVRRTLSNVRRTFLF